MQIFRKFQVMTLVGACVFSAQYSFAQQAPIVVAPAPTVTPAPVVPPAPAVTPAPAAPGVTPPAADTSPGVVVPLPADDGTGDLSIGDVPAVQTIELTPDKARKALDAYVLVQTKYQESPLEDYEDLQAFVDKDPKGKDFETDIKSFGFPDVNNWNLAVTTLSFAYTNALDDQTSELKQQIGEIIASTEMAQDVKDRMVKSLTAMIPSANNAKIVADLIADPTYAEKIKLLETTEE